MRVVVIVVVMSMVVVMPVVVFLEEIRVDVELGVQVEASQVQHLGQRHLAEMHGLDRRAGIHVLEAVDQGVGLFLAHEVGLGQEDLVGEAHLAARFLAVVELLGACLASTRVMMESMR